MFFKRPSINRVFVSHSKRDSDYGLAFVELLVACGVEESRILFSSDSRFGIRAGENIYDRLIKEIGSGSFVVFLLSPNYFSSVASMNEMGAAWAIQNDYAYLMVPGFDMSELPQFGAVLDSGRLGIGVDDRVRVRQLVDLILGRISVFTEDAKVSDACNNFLARIADVQSKPAEQARIALTEVNKRIKHARGNFGPLFTKRASLLAVINPNGDSSAESYLLSIYHDSEYAEAYYGLIEEAIAKRHIDAAWIFADLACNKFPNDARSYLFRARVQREKGKFNEALKDYWKARLIDENLVEAKDGLVHMCKSIGLGQMVADAMRQKELGDFDTARMCFESVLLTDSKNEYCLQEYGGLYWDLIGPREFNQYSIAMKYWEKARSVRLSARNYYLCAIAHDAVGEREIARERCEEGLSLPDDGYHCRLREFLDKISNGS